MTSWSENTRGALLMIGAMVAFTLNDACMKALGADLPLFQALFLRAVGTVACLYAAARVLGGLRFDFDRTEWRLILLRGLGEIGAAYFFITALFNMPLANVTAILMVLPLSTTLAAALFLGEPVGWRRISAIVIGFAGVLLIVRPGTEGFNIYSVYALASVAAVTLRELVTRRINRRVPSLTVALTTAMCILTFAAMGALTVEWQPMGPTHWLQLAGATLFVMTGYLLGVAAMRAGDIGFIAPFRYSSLLVALVVGLLVFAEWPSVLTLIGSAIIMATGIFTLLRERAVKGQA